MVDGPFSLEDASLSLGNALTRHGGRSLLAEGRIPLPRERAHQAWCTAALRWRTRPPRSGTGSPGMVDGRFSQKDASPLARERVHQAWWTAPSRWRTRLRRPGNALPTHGAKTLLALGCTPFARQDAHLVAWSGHPWQEARSPRQVSSTAAKPSRPGSQKRLRLEARQAVTLGTDLIARAVWAPGVASAVLPLFLGAPSARASPPSRPSPHRNGGKEPLLVACRRARCYTRSDALSSRLQRDRQRWRQRRPRDRDVLRAVQRVRALGSRGPLVPWPDASW